MSAAFLLDTRALLWWLAGEPIDEVAADRIADPASVVVVSVASVWEIAIKRASGKLRFDGAVADAVAAADFLSLPISVAHAERAGSLPSHHRDPFDRMLVAQAEIEDLTLVSRDRRLVAYGVAVLAC